MTHENQKDELMIRIATAIYTVAVGAGSEGYKVEDFYPEAIVAIDGVRAYDREQRAKIDASLAPVHNPDDYRDPLTLVTRMDRAPGIREG